MAYKIVSVRDNGSDQLQAVVTDDAGVQHTVQGWVSAVTNHYDAAAYDGAGQIAAGSVPRAMTRLEVGAYVRQLARDQLGRSSAVAPSDIPFT